MGRSRYFSFDPIGNRTQTARDGDTEVYTANNLNQYTERTVPGVAQVAGTAAEDATVTINRPSISGITVEPVTRQGTYFHKKLALDNSSRADVEEIAVVGVKAGAGTNRADIVSAYTGFVWTAKTPETFSYDADGNMLTDALRSYEWDAENRLIAVTASNVVDGSLTRVEMAYDYMNRRVFKTVYNWISNNWSKIENRKFIYDGWNLIKEVSTAEDVPTGLPVSRVVDYYVCGLDISGSLQGAGGIGGLIGRIRKEERFFDDRGLLLICHRPPGNPENYQTIRINASAWPAHEAHGDTLGACAGGSISNSAFLYTFDGNGNVSELLTTDSSLLTPVLAGHYEYSPFGETIVSTGPEAQDNPFRFSTKYWDSEAGLDYYGIRYYCPFLVRWLSRDPSEEEKKRPSLYTVNVGPNSWDYLGMWGITPWPERECEPIDVDVCNSDYGKFRSGGDFYDFDCVGGDHGKNKGVALLEITIEEYWYASNIGRYSSIVKAAEGWHYSSTKNFYYQVLPLVMAHNDHVYRQECECMGRAMKYLEEANKLLGELNDYNEGIEIVHRSLGSRIRKELCPGQ